MGAARDTFAQRSGAYASARPRYPEALYDWLASQCLAREAAWDCATGNGQAAVPLAARFAHVEASDRSREQIEHAERRPNILYCVCDAEETGYRDRSFDLIVVAQALHWFDHARFWREVSRVAKPGALFCAWGYSWMQGPPEILGGLMNPFRELIAPFWAPCNRLLWNGLRAGDIGMPYPPVAAPAFSMRLEWSLTELLAYMQTWSATKLAREDATLAAKLDLLAEAARERFGEASRISIAMPIALVAGRLPA